jgi:hypothetical protein
MPLNLNCVNICVHVLKTPLARMQYFFLDLNTISQKPQLSLVVTAGMTLHQHPLLRLCGCVIKWKPSVANFLVMVTSDNSTQSGNVRLWMPITVTDKIEDNSIPF